jgi:Tol biopolymer transport system component
MARGSVISVLTAGGKLLWRRPGLAASWSAHGELAVTEQGRIAVYSPAGVLRTRVFGRASAWHPSGELLTIQRRTGIWLLDRSGRERSLVQGSEASRNSPLSWSPDGRWFLYDDPEYHSRVVTVDGGPPVRFRDNVHGSRWLADGRLLVFVDDGSGGGLAFLRSPSEQPRITIRLPLGQLPCQSGVRVAASLPDGNVVASVGQQSVGQSDLWAIPVSGGAPRRVLGRAFDWESSPAWSPGGRSLIFQSGEILTHAGWCWGAMEPALWISRADGSGARRLTGEPGTGGFGVSEPAWSPDGRRLAYVDAGDEPAVQVVDVAGGRPALVAAGASSPSWSPRRR